MAISFKSAVAKAKKLYKSGRYAKFSDAVAAAYKKGKSVKRKAVGKVAKKSTVARSYKKAVLRLSPLKRAEQGYASASVAYLKATTISATKAAQKKKAKYAREIKRLRS